jgi:mycothiol S-conjugate amidase
MLCLMQVHAHPDDEASKGSGTTARYAAEGVRTVLVTCTGGEAGDILNPAADTPEARADMRAVRLRELDESVRILGYSSVHLLGYRDSGMPDSEPNKHPDAFANVDFDEAVGKLVAIVRAERPQVMIAYGDEHTYYPHPDHIRAHEIAVVAFDAAGDAARYPGTGEPWEPSKLYYTGWTRRNIEALHNAYQSLEIESPYGDWLQRRGDGDDRFTTRIDVGDFLQQRRDALLAHATQIAPDSFWMRLPLDAHRAAYPYEEYVLAKSRVETAASEDDLFAGLRRPA